MARNKKGRTIWFTRVLWSYMPCTADGFAVMFVSIMAANAGVWSALWVVHALGHPEWEFYAFMTMILPIAALLYVAETHSNDRK